MLNQANQAHYGESVPVPEVREGLPARGFLIGTEDLLDLLFQGQINLAALKGKVKPGEKIALFNYEEGPGMKEEKVIVQVAEDVENPSGPLVKLIARYTVEAPREND